MKTILVQLADTKWTEKAVQAAAELAKRQGARMVLVKALSHAFLDWQGLEASEYRFTEEEQHDLQTYEAAAAALQVPLETVVVKYHDLAEALSEVADRYQADTVIAPVTHGLLSFTSERAIRHLDHVLEEHHHHLYTVEPPAAPTQDYHPTASAAHDNS